VNLDEIVFREGRKEDSRRIAELDNIASDGTLDFLFHDLVPGMSPVQIVVNSLENDQYPHSYRCATVAEHHDRIIGMSLAFPSKYHAMTDELRSFFPADRREHFEDFFASRVENSYFLDALCVEEKYRHRGIGKELVRRTIHKAAHEGFPSVSLIVFSDNERALRLYRKIGFVMVKHVDLQPHALIPHEGGCLLMKYDIPDRI